MRLGPNIGVTIMLLQDLSQAELIAKLEAMQAQLAAANKPRKLTLKVSEKGAVSCYGMGRFPVTLYAGQWERLIAHSGEISSFIEANRALLAVKE